MSSKYKTYVRAVSLDDLGLVERIEDWREERCKASGPLEQTLMSTSSTRSLTEVWVVCRILSLNETVDYKDWNTREDEAKRRGSVTRKRGKERNDVVYSRSELTGAFWQKTELPKVNETIRKVSSILTRQW